jgi:hypothetical protein
MHKFASPSPDSRELVAELEFVWDQVKSNVPSSSSSSPLRTPHQYKSGYSTHDLGQSGRAAMGMGDSNTMGQSAKRNGGDDQDAQPELALKSPMSEADEALEAEPDREVFVDAPDSQYQYNPADDDDNDDINSNNSNSPPTNTKKDKNPQETTTQPNPQALTRAEPIPIQTPTPLPRFRTFAALGKPIAMNFSSSTPAAAQQPPPSKNNTPPASAADTKWRTRIEQALQKQTAEIAALREQLEARRLFTHSPHYRFFRGVWRWVVAAVKHVAVDVFVLGIVLLYLRRKRDRRLEGAMRVLLGDAVAKVGSVGGGLGRVKAWRLGGGGKKTGT